MSLFRMLPVTRPNIEAPCFRQQSNWSSSLEGHYDIDHNACGFVNAKVGDSHGSAARDRKVFQMVIPPNPK